VVVLEKNCTTGKKTTKTDSNKNVRQKKGVAFPVHDNYG